MEPVFIFLPIAILVAVLSFWWTLSRGNAILQRWADQHGYEILSKEYCWFFRGPFFWRSSKNQSVYYVTIRDAEGTRRRGWVRCGGWVWGLMSDATEVVWE